MDDNNNTFETSENINVYNQWITRQFDYWGDRDFFNSHLSTEYEYTIAISTVNNSNASNPQFTRLLDTFGNEYDDDAINLEVTQTSNTIYISFSLLFPGKVTFDVYSFNFQSLGDYSLIIGRSLRSTLFEGTSEGEAIVGTSRDDTIFGFEGNDYLSGIDGNDTIYGGNGLDYLHGGSGDDILIGGTGADKLFGDDGLDVVDYSESNAAVQVDLSLGTGFGGHAEGDEIFNVENIRGSNFADNLNGNNLANIIYGQGGHDVISGEDGHDEIFGGAGRDIIYGNKGNDTLSGDSGRDQLFGGSGRDLIYGGAGADTLEGGNNNDELYGQWGTDTITGGNGHDTLNGGSGNDTLSGGSGFDSLNGGTGNDILTGESGEDTFVFSNEFGNDRVTDFDVSNDTLDLSQLNLTENDLVYENVSEGALITIADHGSILLEGHDWFNFEDLDFIVI